VTSRIGDAHLNEDAALRDRLLAIPIFAALQLRIGPIAQGQATLSAPYDPKYDGIFESLHGGLLMTLADTAACAAILSLTGASSRIVTTDMTIRFLAPCRSDATAVARVLKLGRSLCPVSVDLLDANGVAIAVAQVTYMRLS
jgi:uncharacterized protein (TIGR00369 family)